MILGTGRDHHLAVNTLASAGALVGRLLSVAFLGILFSIAIPNAAWAQAPTEYQVKAVFLFNFAKYIEWPATTTKSQEPIAIGVLGEDPFGDLLEKAIVGKTVNGRRLIILRITQVHEARDCQILFISSSERQRLRHLLDTLKGSSVLTVGDTEGFAQLGGMINFTLEENRVRFEINQDAAEKAGLKISSRLLSLAKIIRSAVSGGNG